jgi:6-phosphogluconolactonase
MNSVSRREFMSLVGTGLVASASAAQGQTGTRMFAYVGSWTMGPFGTGGGGGLHVFSVDMTNGALTPVMRTTGAEYENFHVGYMAVSPNGRFLYATNEVENHDGEFNGGAVVTFAINQTDGSINEVSKQHSMGVYPAYLAIDKTGTMVLIANHGNYDASVRVVKKNGVPEIEKVWDDGTVAIFPVRPDGTLDRASDVHVLDRTTGVDAYSQRSSHAHSVNFDPSYRMALACDKGTDRIYTYRIEKGRTLASPKSFKTAPGIAPRHSSFHPRLPYVYVVNERESSLSVYRYDAATADITFIETLPTVPQGITDRNSPADVHVHPNGRFVYSSNRGNNSLAIFRIDEGTGRLSPVEITPTQGNTPRAFNFDPTGRFVFAANQGSSNIVTFTANPDTGKLTATGAKVAVPRPVCVKFAML